VQQRLRTEIPDIQDVVIHVEPEDTSDAQAASVIPALRAIAEELGFSVHSITTRYSRDGYQIEAHVAVDGTLPLGNAHAMANQLETTARERIERLDAIVTHIEPADDRDVIPRSHLTAEGIAQTIRDLITETYGPERCHGIQVYPVGDNWATSLHLLLDEDMSLSEAHNASSQLEGRLRDAVPRLSYVIVHTEPLFTTERGAR
jgi:divalent metal cation (Fe/Co/Zn/Cd) transporter